MRGQLSVLGIYNHYPNLFSQFVVPAELNRENIIESILIESAELEVLYPRPTVFEKAIGIWCTMEQGVWTHLFQTTQYDYNPIHNYDREHHIKQKNILDGMHTRTPSLKQITKGTDTDTGTIKSEGSNTRTPNLVREYDNDSTQDDFVTGFNSQSLVQSGQQHIVQHNTHTEKGTDFNEGENTDTHNLTFGRDETVENTGNEVNKQDDVNTFTDDGHAFGNIGVTSTQQLIEQEREIAKFNLSDYIVKEFIHRFCLLVY